MKYKNNYFLSFFVKILILFLFFFSFILFIFFSFKNKGILLNSHIVINFPQAYKDRGYNEKMIEGVCLGEGFKKEICEKDQKHFLKKMSFSYAGTSNDAQKIFEHINYYIKTYNIKNFIIPGFSTSDFFKKYINYFAKKHPEVRFIGVDTNLENIDNWYSNFWQVNSLHYYSGYHAGIYAAAWALENKEKFKDSNPNKEGKQIWFSSVGGLSIPIILKFALGFKLGINIFNKMYQLNKTNRSEKIEFMHKYYDDIGSFDNSNILIKNKTKLVVAKQFEQGSSVVFMIATSLVDNAIDAAKEADKKITNGKHFIIGVDIDTYKIIGEQSKKKIITSAIIYFSKIIKDIYRVDFENNEKGKDLIIGGHEYSTIPKRNKDDKVWKKYFGFDKKYEIIKDLNNLPNNILNFKNEQIAKIIKISKKNNIKKGLIYLYIEYIEKLINLDKNFDFKKEYKNILNFDGNLIKYMKNKILEN